MARKGPQLTFSAHVEQNQTMTYRLHQSLSILQSTQIELAEIIQKELNQNPLIEPIDRLSKNLFSKTEAVAERPNIRNHLLRQARETFFNENDLQIATDLIDSLDPSGWLTLPIDELPYEKDAILSVLLTLQTFEPAGIAARSLEECLWLQLRKQPNSLAERIVRNHFDDLIHGRLHQIKATLSVSSDELSEAIVKISSLNFRPKESYEFVMPLRLIPDLTISIKDSRWSITINEEEIPAFSINEDCAQMQKQLKNQLEKQSMQRWMSSASWIQRCMERRRNTLFQIGQFLILKERNFFSNTADLEVLEINQITSLLHVHLSSAWRAVSNKVVSHPNGMTPLRDFFTHREEQTAIQKLLKHSIVHEDKTNPLSDQELVKELKRNGLSCARRTISKYRRSLRILSASKRKALQ